MSQPKKMLLVFVDENDTREELPLYEAIVRRLVQLGVDGATVNAGIMGFGKQHRVHHKRLFGVSDDRPVTISVVDDEQKLRGLVPEIRAMVEDGLILLLDCEQVP